MNSRTRTLLALVSVVTAATVAGLTAVAAPAASGCRLLPNAKRTVEGGYHVEIRRCPASVRVNAPTFWIVKVTTRAGRAAAGRLEVSGGMPDHGHGFLTRPVVTRTGAPGVFRARLVFAMSGRWVIEFRVGSRGRREVARYQLAIP